MGCCQAAKHISSDFIYFPLACDASVGFCYVLLHVCLDFSASVLLSHLLLGNVFNSTYFLNTRFSFISAQIDLVSPQNFSDVLS